MSLPFSFYFILMILNYSLASHDDQSQLKPTRLCLIGDKYLCLNRITYMGRADNELRVPVYPHPRMNKPPFTLTLSISTSTSSSVPSVVDEKSTKSYQRHKMEWDNCEYHEDCGEGHCCYLHFRFRSLPKSFCRPNRNVKNNFCEPLTKYRSLKTAIEENKQRLDSAVILQRLTR